MSLEKSSGIASRQPNAFGIPLGVRNSYFAMNAASGNEVRIPPSPDNKKPLSTGLFAWCHLTGEPPKRELFGPIRVWIHRETQGGQDELMAVQ
jgi:hypothetical protein